MLKIFEYIFGTKKVEQTTVSDSTLLVNGEVAEIKHPILKNYNFDFSKLNEDEQTRLAELLGNNNAIFNSIDEEIIRKSVIENEA